ncbi:DCC1-like thiol-disulfide oxidoreductase family protein [bacterium]|nr:DCC1-like thiol-disulfide oxidoreductase family protein [bacterium]
MTSTDSSHDPYGPASGRPLTVDRDIVFYDGVCALCNRLVRFVMRRDPEKRIAFASLQSPFAARTLSEFGKNPADLNTVYVLIHENGGRRLLTRSDAIAAIFERLPGPARRLAWIRVVPRRLRDFGYRVIARIRYPVFGKLPACPIPAPEDRDRFREE